MVYASARRNTLSKWLWRTGHNFQPYFQRSWKIHWTLAPVQLMRTHPCSYVLHRHWLVVSWFRFVFWMSASVLQKQRCHDTEHIGGFFSQCRSLHNTVHSPGWTITPDMAAGYSRVEQKSLTQIENTLNSGFAYFFILHLFVLCGLYPTPLSHYFQFVCPEPFSNSHPLPRTCLLPCTNAPKHQACLFFIGKMQVSGFMESSKHGQKKTPNHCATKKSAILWRKLESQKRSEGNTGVNMFQNWDSITYWLWHSSTWKYHEIAHNKFSHITTIYTMIIYDIHQFSSCCILQFETGKAASFPLLSWHPEKHLHPIHGFAAKESGIHCPT